MDHELKKFSRWSLTSGGERAGAGGTGGAAGPPRLGRCPGLGRLCWARGLHPTPSPVLRLRLLLWDLNMLISPKGDLDAETDTGDRWKVIGNDEDLGNSFISPSL